MTFTQELSRRSTKQQPEVLHVTQAADLKHWPDSVKISGDRLSRPCSATSSPARPPPLVLLGGLTTLPHASRDRLRPVVATGSGLAYPRSRTCDLAECRPSRTITNAGTLRSR